MLGWDTFLGPICRANNWWAAEISRSCMEKQGNSICHAYTWLYVSVSTGLITSLRYFKESCRMRLIICSCLVGMPAMRAPSFEDNGFMSFRKPNVWSLGPESVTYHVAIYPISEVTSQIWMSLRGYPGNPRPSWVCSCAGLDLEGQMALRRFFFVPCTNQGLVSDISV